MQILVSLKGHDMASAEWNIGHQCGLIKLKLQ